MSSHEPDVIRTPSLDVISQKLPDGSMAIFDVARRNVYSLNTSAAAAWEACESAMSLPALAAAMSRRLNAPVTEDVAREAVSELAAAGLVTVPRTDTAGRSRREMLKQVAGVALPAVLVLTGAEQRAHAQGAGSNPITTTPGTTSTPTTSPNPVTTRRPVPLEIAKGVRSGDNPTQPLPGAEFDVKDAGGHVVAHLVTDQDGKASVMLPPGTYTITETNAPGGLALYEPFPVKTVQLDPNDGANRDYTNVLKPA
jgi:hypothetical protein